MNEEIMNVNETEVEENDYSLPAVQDEGTWLDDCSSLDGVYFEEEDDEDAEESVGTKILKAAAAVVGVGVAAIGGTWVAKKVKEKFTKKNEESEEESEEIELTDEEELAIHKARREREDADIRRLEAKIKSKEVEA